MRDQLKDFTSENRRSFDDEMPSPALWNRIEQVIETPKPRKQFTLRDIYVWTAAAAVFFVTITCVYFMVIRKPPGKPAGTETAGPVIEGSQRGAYDLSSLSPENAREARHIYQAIERQQQQLKTLTTDQPELYAQFSSDLRTLDSSYRVLKIQAEQTPNREVIIRAMMQNLQLQAELLAKQLMILNQFNNNKTNSNETNTTRPL